MDEGYLVKASDLKRFDAAAKRSERNRVPPAAPRPQQRQDHGRPAIVVILFDDVGSGEQVQAAVLEDLTTNETQVITAFGIPSGGYFRLGFNPNEGTSVSAANAPLDWTIRLNPLTATASDIQTALENIPSISPGDVLVEFAVRQTDDGVNHVLNRFQVTFSGQYEGLDVPALHVDDHISGAHLIVESTSVLEDTGRVEYVREVLGVGVPTPIRAGARALCVWVHGIGYVIVSVEARDLGDYSMFLGSFLGSPFIPGT